MPYDAVDFSSPTAIVLGAEGQGLRRLVREKCDHLTSIPMHGHVGSINVSVAAGVVLFEAVRQRRHSRALRHVGQKDSGSDTSGSESND
jgi:23S rRNA (guanosine2251-2'-O)-methyltransferase